MTRRRMGGYIRTGRAQGFGVLGRLVYAVAVSAAFCVHALGGSALAAQPRAAVEGEVDPRLRAAILRAIGETDRPIQNRFEARRRASEAARDAVAVLRSEGYYASQVEPDVGEGDAPAAIVRVEPGPLFHIGQPGIDWSEPAPDQASMRSAYEAMALEPGRPGRAEEVVAAEGRIIAAVQKRGYADAAPQARQVVVDHADLSVRPTYRIYAGPLVRLDGVEVITEGRTNPQWVAALAPWRSGEPYDPDDVAELERRLLDASVFDGVTVALAPVEGITLEGLRPVIVSLAERKPRRIELGASYDTIDGAGVDARWTRYNLLRRADTFSVDGRVSGIDSHLRTDLALPHWRRHDQTLRLSAQVYRDRTDAYDQTGVGSRADVERRYSKTSYVTVGASVDVGRIDEVRIDALTPIGRDLVTLALLGDMAMDRSDDPLNPTHGYRLNGRAEPTLVLGDDTTPYLKIQGQASAYLPIGRDAKTVLAGRVRLGSIVNSTIGHIPASQRFYAGGGGSVRGFGYQDVGPRLADGRPIGGLSLMELSSEARRELTDRWGVAAFVDAGAIGTRRFPTFKDLSVGAGVGIRYDLGFGPIRLDLAFPVNNRQDAPAYQIYVSIGQSF